MDSNNHSAKPGAANRIEAARVFLAGIADDPSAYDLVTRQGSLRGGVTALRKLLETSRSAASRGDTKQEWAALSLALGLAEETFAPASPECAEAASARWFYLWDQVESASAESDALRLSDELLKRGSFESHAAARDLFASAAEVMSPQHASGRGGRPPSAARPQRLRLVPDLVPTLVPRQVTFVRQPVDTGRKNTDAPKDAADFAGTSGQGDWWSKAALVAGLCAVAFVPLALASRDDGQAATATAVVRTGAPAEQLPLLPRELAERFLDAPSHAERAELLRDPRTAFAMRDHFDLVAEQGIESERADLISMGEWVDHGVVYHPFHVRFSDGRERYLAVVDGPGGRFIDWDAYGRTGTASWGQLFEGDADRADVRVVVRPDDFYNREFADISKYECLRLTTPDVEGAIYGYVEHGSTTQKIIHDVFGRKRLEVMRATGESGVFASPPPVNDLPFTLAIRSVGDSHEHRQFLIERVVAGSWVANAAGDLQDRWIDPGEGGNLNEADQRLARRMARRADDHREKAALFGSGIGFSL